jgi:hypothetical protein
VKEMCVQDSASPGVSAEKVMADLEKMDESEVSIIKLPIFISPIGNKKTQWLNAFDTFPYIIPATTRLNMGCEVTHLILGVLLD